MTKTEALVLLTEALKETKELTTLRFLLAEFTLAAAQHKEGKLTDSQLIAKVRNLAHIDALNKEPNNG